MGFRLAQATCPECEAEAIDILETVPCHAHLMRDVDGVTFAYAGESDMNWDGQEPILDSKGAVQVYCENGHTWETVVFDHPQAKPHPTEIAETGPDALIEAMGFKGGMAQVFCAKSHMSNAFDIGDLPAEALADLQKADRLICEVLAKHHAASHG